MLASALFPDLDGAPVALQQSRTLRQAQALYHTANSQISQFVKVRNDTFNVKEFREEESTLNHVTFLSKNLDHLNPYPDELDASREAWGQVKIRVTDDSGTHDLYSTDMRYFLYPTGVRV